MGGAYYVRHSSYRIQGVYLAPNHQCVYKRVEAFQTAPTHLYAQSSRRPTMVTSCGPAADWNGARMALVTENVQM